MLGSEMGESLRVLVNAMRADSNGINAALNAAVEKIKKDKGIDIAKTGTMELLKHLDSQIANESHLKQLSEIGWGTMTQCNRAARRKKDHCEKGWTR